MPYNAKAEEFTNCTVQIVDDSENVIEENDLNNFFIAKVHLIPIGGTEADKVKCSYEMENGRLVLKCRRVN